jgi:hypothetical protein
MIAGHQREGGKGKGWEQLCKWSVGLRRLDLVTYCGIFTLARSLLPTEQTVLNEAMVRGQEEDNNMDRSLFRFKLFNKE